MSLPLHGRPSAEPPQAGLNGYNKAQDNSESVIPRNRLPWCLGGSFSSLPGGPVLRLQRFPGDVVHTGAIPRLLALGLHHLAAADAAHLEDSLEDPLDECAVVTR